MDEISSRSQCLTETCGMNIGLAYITSWSAGSNNRRQLSEHARIDKCHDWKECRWSYEPVCSRDSRTLFHRTFSNMCVFERAIRCMPEYRRYKFVHKGECLCSGTCQIDNRMKWLKKNE